GRVRLRGRTGRQTFLAAYCCEGFTFGRSPTRYHPPCGVGGFMSVRSLLRMAALATVPLFPAGVAAQVTDAAPDTVADIPVNNTESLVGNYTLPDPLVMANGTPVR